jgi:hypothetical protein
MDNEKKHFFLSAPWYSFAKKRKSIFSTFLIHICICYVQKYWHKKVYFQLDPMTKIWVFFERWLHAQFPKFEWFLLKISFIFGWHLWLPIPGLCMLCKIIMIIMKPFMQCCRTAAFTCDYTTLGKIFFFRLRMICGSGSFLTEVYNIPNFLK